jgi:hypothetical protein
MRKITCDVKVTADNVTDSDILDTFTVQGSTLGLDENEHPMYITTDLGNGRDFKYDYMLGDTAVYRQVGGGIQLYLLND